MANGKRDAGGGLVTDYSKTSLSPERAKKLQKAELDYINGLPDEENPGCLLWPSYRDLAEKYDIPLKVLETQANRHKWVSRRERRKTAMIMFQNEQTRKRWLEMDRQVVGIIMDQIGTATSTIARIQYEHQRMIRKAEAEEAVRIGQGETDAVVRVGIRPAEIESLLRSAESVAKTAERLHQRIQALPLVENDRAELPYEAKPYDEEQAELEAGKVPQATLSEIYKQVMEIETQAKRDLVIQAERIDSSESGDDDTGEGTVYNVVVS